MQAQHKPCETCGKPVARNRNRFCSHSCRRGLRGPYEPFNANTTWTEAQLREAVAASGTIAEVARRLDTKSRGVVRKYIAQLGLDTGHFRGYGHVSDEVRFWRKVDKASHAAGCWLWLDQPNEDGYGRFTIAGKKVMAHRFAYESSRGPVPVGLELDHTCVNPVCVNPAHLEAVTHAENVRRIVERLGEPGHVR